MLRIWGALCDVPFLLRPLCSDCEKRKDKAIKEKKIEIQEKARQEKTVCKRGEKRKDKEIKENTTKYKKRQDKKRMLAKEASKAFRISIATHRCNTLQHTAMHCNTLQDSARNCKTLQHTEPLISPSTISFPNLQTISVAHLQNTFILRKFALPIGLSCEKIPL